MKFINYLESIAGIGIFPLISLLIFFFFFLALVFYVMKADRNVLTLTKNIPLDETEHVNRTNNTEAL